MDISRTIQRITSLPFTTPAHRPHQNARPNNPTRAIHAKASDGVAASDPKPRAPRVATKPLRPRGPLLCLPRGGHKRRIHWTQRGPRLATTDTKPKGTISEEHSRLERPERRTLPNRSCTRRLGARVTVQKPTAGELYLQSRSSREAGELHRREPTTYRRTLPQGLYMIRKGKDSPQKTSHLAEGAAPEK